MLGEVIVKVILEKNDCRYTYYLHIQDTTNEPVSEGCDDCIDYTVFDEDHLEVDGGEMDFNSDDKNYTSIKDTIEDVIDFAFDGSIVVNYETTNLSYEDFE